MANRERGAFTENGAALESIAYAYAATGGEPLEEGVIPARSMSFFFANGVLVGEEFLSSFKSDQTNFDDAKVPSIVKGRSTRAEVIHLLGAPTCRHIMPLAKNTTREAIGYAYNTTRGGAFSGFKISSKSVLVSFDASDRVSDVEFTSNK